MRKIFGLFLLCLTVWLVLPIISSASIYSGTCGEDLYWVLNESGVLSISGTGEVADYKNGEQPWYPFKEEIKKIVVSEGITKLGNCAFSQSVNLTVVELPQSLLNIASGVFEGCSGLVNIDLPDKLTYLGDFAFSNCINLKSIEIPDGVTTIQYCTFYKCENLINIDLPDNLTNIVEWAFGNCKNLKSIEIPDGVFVINNCIFYECISLESISLPDNLTVIGDWSFAYCRSLKNIEIPDSVTNIGEYVFYCCTSLLDITLPKNIKTIRPWSFGYCENITSIILPESLETIESFAFYCCNNMTNLSLPDNLKSIGEFVFSRWWYIESIELPDNLTSIGKGAFEYCTSLKSIVLPDGLTIINDEMFVRCENLKDIYIPFGIASIGWNAFLDCYNLTNVYYNGLAIDWSKISIDFTNSCLNNAKFHYRDGSYGDSLMKNITVNMWDRSGKMHINYDNILNSDYSYCIDAPQPNDIRIIKTFDVEKNKYYNVSAYFKTENVVCSEGGSIGANISYGNWNLSSSLVGNNDWTKLNMTIYSGDSSQVDVSFNLGYFSNLCSGKVYISDIDLKEVVSEENSEWKFLFVIFKNNDIEYTDSNGNIIYEKNSMTDEEIDIITETAKHFEEDLSNDCNGLFTPSVDVVVIEKPIQKLSGEVADGLWLAPDEAYNLIKESVNIDFYDHITAFANLNTIPTSYFGLGGTHFSQNTGYSFINTQNKNYCMMIFNNDLFWSSGVVVHEFLHFMETWSAKLNHGISISLHDAEEYGYNDDNEWRDWYFDFINNNVVIENEQITGISEVVWKLSPKDFRFPQDDEAVYIALNKYSINNGIVKIDTTIANDSESPKNANIIVAFYKNSKLVDLQSVPVELAANSSQVITKEISAEEHADVAKVFVWKDTNEISPYNKVTNLNIVYSENK